MNKPVAFCDRYELAERCHGTEKLRCLEMLAPDADCWKDCSGIVATGDLANAAWESGFDSGLIAFQKWLTSTIGADSYNEGWNANNRWLVHTQYCLRELLNAFNSSNPNDWEVAQRRAVSALEPQVNDPRMLPNSGKRTCSPK